MYILLHHVAPFSTETHFYYEFWVWLDDFIEIKKFYVGQKINGQSLYYFNPHMSLCKCIKSPNDNNKQNRYKNVSQYLRG